MTYIVYILKSVDHNYFYVGMTKDIDDRIKRHNSGREKTTKPYKPFELVYTKEFGNRLEARDFEKYLKVRSNKEKLIKSLRYQ